MAKPIAFLMTALLSVYMAFSVSRGLVLISSESSPAKVLGVAVILIPLLGSYLVYREIRFGFATARIAKLVDPELLPMKIASDEENEAYLEAAVETAKLTPESWVAWYQVALGYHITGDRKHARESMRHAVALQSDPQIAATTL